VYTNTDRVRGGLEKKNKKFSEDDRRRTAIHEAGKTTYHCLMLHRHALYAYVCTAMAYACSSLHARLCRSIIGHSCYWLGS
jgi:hypothetical protein